jgi:hypothetical protein
MSALSKEAADRLKGALTSNEIGDEIAEILHKVSHLGSSLSRYVDPNKGSDTKGDGTASSPFKTLKRAQSTITDASIDRQYVLFCSPGTYLEASDYEYKPNISIVGAGIGVTIIGREDNGPMYLHYGTDPSFNLFMNASFNSSENIIERRPGEFNDGNTWFLDSEVFGLSATGSGLDDLIGYDAITVQGCLIRGSPFFGAVSANIVNSRTNPDVYIYTEGVDGVNTSPVRSTIYNCKLSRVKVYEFAQVVARNSQVNKWFLNGTDCFVSRDVVSMTTTPDGYIGGATVDQTEMVSPVSMLDQGTVKTSSMTTAERDALTAKAGMIIFNTSTSKHQGFDGTSWNNLY